MRIAAFLLALCLCVSSVHTPPAAGQAPDSTVSAADEKSPFAAAALEYVIPTLGHAYAGDWVKGLPPLLVTGAGGAMLYIGSDCDLKEGLCEGLFVGGLAALIVGRIWGVVGAALLADAYRADPDVAVVWDPRAEGPSLRVSWGP